MIVLTRRVRWIIGLSAAIVMAAVSLPLAFVLPMALPNNSGVNARRAEGTIWQGTLRDASIAGLPLGDTNIGFDVLPFMSGEARFGFASASLRGIIDVAPNAFGLSRGNGVMVLAGRLYPLPLSRFTLEDAAVEFRGDRCISAKGRVRADVAGDIGGLALPGGLSGALRCDGPDLVVPLVGQSGMERVDMHLTATGKWRAHVSVRTNDPVISAKLLASGFVSGPGGYTLRVRGAL